MSEEKGTPLDTGIKDLTTGTIVPEGSVVRWNPVSGIAVAEPKQKAAPHSTPAILSSKNTTDTLSKDETATQPKQTPLQEDSAKNPSDRTTRKGFIKQAKDLTIPILASSIAGGLALEVALRSVDPESVPADYEVFSPMDFSGKKFRFIGLAHQVRTFQENENDIMNRVNRAPFVFSEFDPVMYSAIDEGTGGAFIHRFNKVCADAGKDIIVVDPHNFLNEIEWLGLLIGIPGTLIATDVKKVINRIKNKPISRRHILRGIGYAAAINEYLANAKNAREVKSSIQSLHESASDDNLVKLDKSNEGLYNFHDWRNLRSAQGIRKAFQIFGKEIPSTEEVPMFAGLYHSALLAYLKHPEKIDDKLKLYPQWNITSPSSKSVWRYSFSRQPNKWEQTGAW